MYIFALFISLFSLNTLLLFHTQSLVLLFCFLLLLIIINNFYKKMQIELSQFELVEWIETIKFYIMLKNWNMFYIRMVDIKLYNFYKFVTFLKNKILYLLSVQRDIFYKNYIDSVNTFGLYLLLNNKRKFLVLRKFVQESSLLSSI